MTTALAYGYKELQTSYNRTMGRAFLASILVLLVFVSIYFLSLSFPSDETINPIAHSIRFINLGDIPQQTHLGTSEAISISASTVKASFGIPVPVPDGSISSEATIKDQNTPDPGISESHGTESGVATAGDQIVLPPENEPDPEPGTFLAIEQEPLPLHTPAPEYPSLAQRAGIEGIVWVQMLVTKDGTIKKATIQKSTAEIFNAAALEAAQRWTFRPGLMNNRPVAVWVSIPFRFRLQGH